MLRWHPRTRSPLPPPFPSLKLQAHTGFPTCSREHLPLGILQQLHGELRAVSAGLEDKITIGRAQRPHRHGRSELAVAVLLQDAGTAPGSPAPAGNRALLAGTCPFLSGIQLPNACSYLLRGGWGKVGEPFREAHGSQRGVDRGSSSAMAKQV